MAHGPTSLYPKEVTLTNCDREPIHILGKIQKHGYLIACDATSHIVNYCSDNIAQILDKSPEALLGQSLKAVFDEVQTQQLLETKVAEKATPIHTTIEGQHYAMLAHLNEGNLVVEFEPLEVDANAFEYQNQLAEIVSKLNGAGEEQRMCDVTADLIKEFFGYDRVMIYRFDEHWDGIVVSEARESHLESWLGLRYPASDIPQQARKLFLKQGVRIIADVTSTPVHIQALGGKEQENPIDLSLSETRASSPIHIEYLENMNVGASLTAAIISEGALWGLIACHHYSPKFVDFYKRQSCKFLTQIFSSQLVLLSSNILLQKLNEASKTRSLLMEKITKNWNVHKGLTKGSHTMLDLTQAQGAAVFLDGKLKRVGITPDKEQILALINRLKPLEQDEVITTQLTKDLPELQDIKAKASGVMCLFLSNLKKDAILWFKSEKIETVNWAGNPDKLSTLDSNERLTPRKSFEAWSIQEEGKSAPWEDYEIVAARALKQDISQIILEKYDEIKGLHNLLQIAYEDLETFSYSVAHDLRAPLRGIDGFAHIIKEDYFEQLDEFGKSSIDTIIGSATKMNQLIDDILAFSMVSQSEMNKDKFSMNKLVDDVLGILPISQDYPSVSITVAPQMPQAYGDRKMIAQVLQNLLTNALKYTRAVEQPQITIGFKEHQNKGFYFVQDNGIGFDQSHEKRIFRLFNRLVGDEYEGSGIGLTIAKRIIKKHKGAIAVISKPGEGSTFLFNLG
ncbi:GAF domain-containing protein [Leeuwenhoekiella palythoae]|uniref:ATP-binding protein n=1 Tax=Leeuwenhoekiella palythoae TaxID=573501 RepID=UPI001CE15D92|nr:ATP-binding protein [Leeuwenhoekiella palythoae]UBZ10695.1 GAF domain-containing protein [Leeuwenhoekiella palythoae]